MQWILPILNEQKRRMTAQKNKWKPGTKSKPIWRKQQNSIKYSVIAHQNRSGKALNRGVGYFEYNRCKYEKTDDVLGYCNSNGLWQKKRRTKTCRESM